MARVLPALHVIGSTKNGMMKIIPLPSPNKDQANKLATTYNGWVVPSQNVRVVNTQLLRSLERESLPILAYVLRKMESISHHAWDVSSWLRASPSHQYGYSWDIIPSIAESAKNKYAVTRMSDPVLYKREKLIRQLQRFAKSVSPSDLGLPPSYMRTHALILAVESDHIHVQLVKRGPNIKSPYFTTVLKWGIPKPAYSDTLTRSKLSLIQ